MIEKTNKVPKAIGSQPRITMKTHKLTLALTLLAITVVMAIFQLFIFKSVDRTIHTGLLLIPFSVQQKIPPKTSKKSPAKLTSYILITVGTVAFLLSIWYVSIILAFIGLGVLFWGILFTYIRTDEYTKKTLLDAIACSQITMLNQIRQELGFTGNPIYLPPKYFKDPETQKVYIPKQNEVKLPTLEQIQRQEQQLFIQSPLGMLITPPGSELAKLFEKTLNTNFNRVDIPYIQHNMPKLLVEDLEIVNNFEMRIDINRISIKLENSAYPVCKETKTQLSTLDFPLSSAIACALAKTTGKPIIIEEQQTSQDNKTITILYHIMEEAQTKP